MAHAIILPTEFESDAINFLPPRQNKLGGQSVLVNYNSSAFIMQTCRMRVPFGIDSSKPENGGPVRYHISLAMANEETQNEQLRKFTTNIRSIDDLAKKHPQENADWFGKKLSGELVAEFYKSAEKFPKDPKWPSNLKVKLPFDKNGKPQFVLYDEAKKPIEVCDEEGNINSECIPRGSELVCLVQSTGVWFVGKTQYGVGWKLLQAKVYKSNKLSGYSIVDSEEEEEEEDVE